MHTPHHVSALTALAAKVAATSSGHTLPEPLPYSPFPMLKEWLDDEVRAQRTPNPNAMSLATVDPDGTIGNRIVLCRGIDTQTGSLTFFTNYQGRKGRSLLREGWQAGVAGTASPQRAAVCFHWDATDRQARVEGLVVPTSASESDAYFASRRWESRLAAWASNQSEPIASRAALLNKLGDVCARLNLDPQALLDRGNEMHIPRPPHWGGFRLIATRAELWMGGPTRLHDRAQWERALNPQAIPPDLAILPWLGTRIQP